MLQWYQVVSSNLESRLYTSSKRTSSTSDDEDREENDSDTDGIERAQFLRSAPKLCRSTRPSRTPGFYSL